jgi:CO dehydrogenase/acetyl-CoA synthase beta subunit
MSHAIPAILEPSGQVRLLEPVQVTVPTRVIVTIPEPVVPATEDETQLGNTQSLLKFLRENRLPVEARLSAEEIDAQIEAERNAWD